MYNHILSHGYSVIIYSNLGQTKSNKQYKINLS